MSTKRYRKLMRAIALVAPGGTLLAAATAGFAANVTHTVTDGTTGDWSTSTWTNGVPNAVADIAESNGAAGATLTLDLPVTIGSIQINTAGTGAFTINATGGNVLTFDATGMTAGGNAFGSAGVSAIASRGLGALLTINPDISFGATNLDIGATNTGGVVINGNITATANRALTFRGAGTGGVTVNGNIGASGSLIALSSTRGSNGGGVTIGGVLGSSVASININNTTASTRFAILQANSNFSGPVTVNAGVLSLGAVGALGTGTLVITGTGSNAFIEATTPMNGLNKLTNAISLVGSMQFSNNTANQIEVGGPIGLSAGSHTIFAGTSVSTNPLLISGNISGASGAGVNFQRFGSADTHYRISGSNSFTGPTTIQNGNAYISNFGMTGANSNLGRSGSLVIGAVSGSSSAVTLTYDGAGESSDKVITLAPSSTGNTLDSSGSGPLTLTSDFATSIFTTASTRTFTLGGTNTGLNTIGGVLAGPTLASSFLAVNKSGTGTWVLNGNNTFNGALGVNAGTLVLGQAGAAGTSGGKFITVTGTLATMFAPDAAFMNKIVATSGGVLAIGADSAIDLPAAGITGNLSIGAWQNSTLTAYTPVGTTYRLGGGIADLTVSANLTAAANIMSVNPGGRVILTGANTFAGNITMTNASILRGTDTAATHSGTDVTLTSVLGSSSGVINVSAVSATTTLELRANGENDGSVQVMHFNKTYQASGAGLTLNLDADRYSGTGTNKTLTINYINLGVLNSPDLSQLTTVNVTGANGYNVASRSATAMTLGGGASSGGMLLNPTTANLFIEGNVTNSGTTNAVKTLILGGTSQGSRIQGAINNASSNVATTVLIKNNSSTWTLNGASGYSGGTTVAAGRLMVNGVGSTTVTSGLGVGSVQVTGGTLGGTGRIIGATTVGNGARLLAGDGVSSAGDIEFTSDLTMQDGSQISLVLGSGGAHSTLTRSGTGTWTFDSDQAFVFLTDGAVAVDDPFNNIITGLDVVAFGDTPINLPWTTTGGSAVAGNFVYDGAGGVDFTVTAVPEPTALGLLALGGVGLLSRRRRRR